MSEFAIITKVLRVHSGEGFAADDFPTLEDGKAAVEALTFLLSHIRRIERAANAVLAFHSPYGEDSTPMAELRAALSDAPEET